MEQKRQHFYQFGPFVLDTVQHALLRENQPVPLTPKTYDTLLVLVENTGRMLSKDELMKALWPDSFVEESNLTVQISAIRRTLGEVPGERRYIVTVPGRGYRFSADVKAWSQDEDDVIIEDRSSGEVVIEQIEDGEQLSPAAPAAMASAASPSVAFQIQSQRRSGLVLGAAIAGVVMLAFVLFLAFRPPLPSPRVLRSTQLTTFGRVHGSKILTDGTRVYFLAHRLGGAGSSLNQVSFDGAESAEIPIALEPFYLFAISPDHSELLAGGPPEAPGQYPLWAVSVLGGSPRRLGNIAAYDAQWTPDGQGIVYSAGASVYLADSDGTRARKLLTASGLASDFRWSPSGQVLRFTVTDQTTSLDSMWEASRDGARLKPILPPPNSAPIESASEWSSGEWTPDGTYFIFQRIRDGQSSIWAMREKPSIFHKSSRDPVALSAGPVQLSHPVLSPDGKRLFVISEEHRAELVRYQTASSAFLAYLPGLQGHRLSFSRDGQWMAYTTYPDGQLWRSKADGSAKLRLTFPPIRADVPRWSPDGKQIVFTAGEGGKPSDLYLITADGGQPQRLLTQGGNGNPDWSPDGAWIVFGPQPTFATDPAAGLETQAAVNAIQILDLKTKGVSELPGSKGLYWPRWSANGKYIVCLTIDTQKLMLFDIKTQKWAELAAGQTLHNPLWSRDREIVYFQDLGAAGQPIYRVNIVSRKMERVAGAEGLGRPDIIYSAFTGLTPEDSPVVLLIRGLYDIYALDLALP